MKPSDFPRDNPITLALGQSTQASIVGYDQDGNVFNGPLPTPSWSVDQKTLVDLSGGNSPTVTSLDKGTATLLVTVETPGGQLSDGQQVTNVTPNPVLSAIKIQFTPPFVSGQAPPSKKTVWGK